MASYAYSSPVLFHIAREAVDRAREQRSQSLVAIIFSAAGIEAFVNETLDSLQFPIEKGLAELDQLRAVATAAGLFGKSASLATKVQLLSATLAGHTFDVGAQPFQDFDLLIALRNALLHQRIERIPDVHSSELPPNKIVQRLISRGLVAPDDSGIPSPMIGPISDPSVAEWALKTGTRMVFAITALLPQQMHGRIQMAYASLKVE